MLGAVIALVLSVSLGAAQTTLSGNHVVTGNLSVGTSTTKGNLNVTGQTGVGSGNSLNVTGDGWVVFSGALGVGSGSLTAQTQPAFIWIPSKAAVRVGEALTGDYLIGQESLAVGSYSEASGDYSFSAAIATAAGPYSAAFAGGTAFGEGSFGTAAGTASGSFSVAFASGSAFGGNSFATGSGQAFGDYSFATNAGWASGAFSFAVLGHASGQYSSVIGEGTKSSSLSCVTVGSFSPEGSYSADSWVPTDPIFIVSNGSGKVTDPLNVQRSDALRVLKNGNVIIPKRQGDILMGEFGNPE